MRKLISTFILCFCTICLVSAQDTFWLGADISGTTMHEKNGRQLYNAKGEPRENTQLMKELGLNSIRLRVWVEPKDSLCNKEDMLKLALRAKHYGMPVMIDFHYSDHWADPAHQDIPKSWQHLSYKKMKKALYKHTKETLALLKKHDIDVRWVQVGNETTQGFLWPMGHTKENMEQYAGLSQSGYEAVKKVYPDAQVIIHLDCAADPHRYNHIFDGLRKYGAKWDMIGVSVYPYWDIKAGHTKSAEETLEKAIANINRIQKKYNCPTMVVEAGVEKRKPVEGKAFIAALIKACKTQTGGQCKGVYYWAPELERHYPLGAFMNDRPTAIMEAFTEAAEN